MKAIRKILVKVLGLKGYLRLVSRAYIILIGMGRMKDKYGELFFVKKIVKPGDVVLDIGSNLGYYSYFMAYCAGKEGKLMAVEPIPLFAEIWNKNMRKYMARDIALYNCALGAELKERVRMSIPVVDGVVRHGLTSVTTVGDEGESVMIFEVPMKMGDQLIADQNLEQLDYIKCDVEGYEQYVIPSLDETIEKFKPLLQVELGGKENRESVVNFLLKKGFSIFILKAEFLHPIQKNDIFSVDQDFYFIHQSKLEEKKPLLETKHL